MWNVEGRMWLRQRRKTTAVRRFTATATTKTTAKDILFEHLPNLSGANMKENWEKILNLKSAQARLDNLAGVVEKSAIKTHTQKETGVNNHIHTTYSFSPYSPTMAVWMSVKSGLMAAGIVDHDSIGGAREFAAAGRIAGLPTTAGVECRADFSHTRLKGKRLNNPDQVSNAYIVLHGVPARSFDQIDAFFETCRRDRNERNRLMTAKLNDHFKSYGIRIDFEKDVLPLSEYRNGGTVTERHLLFALARKLTQKYDKGRGLLNAIRKDFDAQLTPQISKYLTDPDNLYYEYDLLGLLKKDTSYFAIPADRECPPVSEVIDLALAMGAIPAYAYLGDVSESVTGDKKCDKFEDDYLDLLFEVLVKTGFQAITYMPARNTSEQLERVKKLCRRHDLFQISGEDINSPRQPFISRAIQRKEFANLTDSTWALIGHEAETEKDFERGMFSEKSLNEHPDMQDRIQIYKEIGKRVKTG